MSDQEYRNINGDFRFELKRIASQGRLNLDELKEIIAFCGVFFSQDLPQKFGKSFNLPFMVEGFAGKTFRLEKSNKIETQLKLLAEVARDQTINPERKKAIIAELNNKKDKFKQDNLFLGDLIAFLEQASVQLAKFLNSANKQELAKLGNDYFNRIGLAPKTASNQIPLIELKKLEENSSIWQKVNNDLAQSMLDIINLQELKFVEEREDPKKKKLPTAAVPQKAILTGQAQDVTEEVETDGEATEEPEKKDLKQTLPEDFSKEFNLARLDDHSKLYIRSLAVIAVNQSLLIQFANLSKEQLAEMGFGDPPNFNQLSLENRQQLLSIAFSKIENLLASGQYDLAELIDKPSMRIIFAKNVALKVMTDIRGGEIFASELGKLTSSDLSKKRVAQQLDDNQNQLLTQEELGEKISVSGASLPASLKVQVNNLSTEEAEKFFKQLDSQQELKKSFVKNIGKSFTRVTKESFLKEWQKIVANDKTAMDKSFLAKENILPIIDVFIQQNYPVEYIESFDWNRFQAHFGREIISQNTYLANKKLIDNLIAGYWKTKRAELSKFHPGIETEFYETKDIDKMWAEFDGVGEAKTTKNNKKASVKTSVPPQTIGQIGAGELAEETSTLSKTDKQIIQKQAIYLQQLKQQAQFNLIDADAVTQILAGIPQEKINLNKFNREQIENLNNLKRVYQQNYLDIINESGSRAQTVTLSYYFPGEEYTTENIFLQAESIPQFSPYDLGVLNYNQAFGPDKNGQYPFTREFNQNGGIESALQESFEGAEDLVNQGVDFLGEKAVRAGLTYATGGAFETLPEPIKQMIEKVAWGEVKKRLESLKKIATFLFYPVAAGILNLIFKAAKAIGKVIGFFKPGGQTSLVIGGKQAIFSDILPTTEAVASTQAAAPSVAATEAVAPNQLAERAAAVESQGLAQSEAVQLSAAKPVLAEVASGAMVTAGQAVASAFGLVAGGMVVYHTVISSAFLTEFPTGRYGSVGGSAVFCDDVIVGNLTYYNQNAYNNIPICDGCSFGSSSCGPVTISMILNEDPIQMSISEGYLIYGGCGLTSCGGTDAAPLINTLKDKGFNVSQAYELAGSPGYITDEISKYLAQGNVIFALGFVRGYGHYVIITCVEEPGYVVTYDSAWGKNTVHKVVSTTGEGLMLGTNHIYIRYMWTVSN